MALTITLNKYASSNLQAVHRTPGKAAHTSTPTLSTKLELGRRGVVLCTLLATTQIPDSRTQLLQSTHFSPFSFFSLALYWSC